MSILFYNIGTTNTSSSGLAVIQPTDTIVVYSGSNFKTPDTNGVFQNISIGGNSPFGSLIWEWNKTDVSQFLNNGTSSMNLGSLTDIATAFVTSSISHGSFLRFNAATASFNGHNIWLIQDNFEFNNSANFIVEFDVVNFETTAGTPYAGLIFAVDSGSLLGNYGIIHYFGSNEYAGIIQSGSFNDASGTGGARRTGIIRYNVSTEKRIGERLVAYSSIDGNLESRARILANSAEVNVASISTYANAALTSSWQDVNPTKFGIAMHNFSGPIGILDIKSLRIFQK